MSFSATRYHLLNELRHNRARMRVGSISEAHGTKERKARDLAKLRRTRNGGT